MIVFGTHCPASEEYGKIAKRTSLYSLQNK
jgi:hypothetical protein